MAAFPLLLLVMFVVMVVVPQRRRMRQHQALISAIAPGERVLTASGIYGVVVDVRGETLVLSVAPGVTLHVLRRAVARQVSPDETDAPSATALGVADVSGAAPWPDPEAPPPHETNAEEPPQ